MKQSEFERLKQKALTKLKEGIGPNAYDYTKKSIDELVEINEIYHVELESQNEELQESIGKLERLTDELTVLFFKSPVPMLVLSDKMQIVRFNDAAQLFFGNKINYTVPAFIHSLLPNDTIHTFLGWIESVDSDKEPADFDFLSRDGVRNCRLRVYERREEEKTYLLTIEDIHEKMQLLNSFKHLADTIPDMVMRIDQSALVTYANLNAQEFFSLSAESGYVKVTDFDFFNCLQCQDLLKALQSLEYVLSPRMYSITQMKQTYLVHLIPERKLEEPQTYLLVVSDITARVEDEQMFHQVFYYSADAIVLTNHQTGEVSFINAKAKALLGIENLEVSQINSHKIFDFFSTDSTYHDHIHALNEKGEDQFETELSTPDHRQLYLRVYCTLIDIGSNTFHQSIIHDLTDHKMLEKQLRQNSKVFEHTVEGIMITDLDGTILSVNDAFTKITGYKRDEIVGKKPSVLKSGKHDDAFYDRLWHEVNTSGVWKGEVWNKKKDGTIYPEWLAISPIYDEKQTPIQYVAVFSDFTEIKKSQELLNRLAHYDTLTKLPNRLLLSEQLKFAMKSAHRNKSKIALLFIDLDRFKAINDTYGHSVGDEVLIETAHRLKGVIRDSDTVARLGGDEFVVVLYDYQHRGNIEHVARKILHTLETPIVVQKISHFVSASIGISVFPEDAMHAEALFKNADIAMYAAKSQGKNRYSYFYENMAEEAKSTHDLFNDLKRACEKSEFYLKYQPQFDLSQRRVIGFEALLRWKHPVKGEIPPDRFIEHAEESGLIRQIGNMVINEVCEDIQRFKTDTDDIKIAVNVSNKQLDDDFVAMLQSKRRQYDDLDKYLKIEITETTAMTSMEHASRALSQLREIGFMISLDDFGTGYSSLNAIKNLKIDEIKIDRSFINDVPGDKEDEELVAAIIAIAKVMKKTIIAEGVEREETCDFLLDRRCSIIQGFLISEPLPIEEAIALMRRYNHA